MQAQVVVWNVDARNRPELEVEIEIVRDDIDDALASSWFIDDGVPLSAADEMHTIHDSPPTGYAQAYLAAA